MNNAVNRQYRLKTRPVGRIETTDFDFVTEPLSELEPGQARVRVLYLSLDPTNRIWMSDMDQYMPPVEIGAVMRGGGIGVVVDSNSSRYEPGNYVLGLTGWQDYCIADEGENAMTVLPADLPIPLPTMMGACGMTGVTAYFGLLELGRPKPGETVLVSAAAGAVGSVVGQIAKIQGCRVVGIAGGPDKCRYLVDELGFDEAVDYKRDDWREQLAAATPDGIDVNFENVGGEIMEAVMARMNLFGRMPLCGMISGYNSSEPARADFSPILMRRIEVRGFIVTDFMERFAEATQQLALWLLEGKLRHQETIIEGLENAPTAVNLLFDGGNIGKLIVKVADAPGADAPS
ncbi:NADP-dependent oxidoreductase [Kineobactrum sediminis]|uniref:NADP-dependent oxidoreductase n=1 Tax=Kineobactrum sediminis TaxID=1905677 RepID=A0A2N5Y5R8_9GAMM|nr:NADP-dependent oxidoreductase [Kineobactrum sediminis]PLW83743.1 NADP-dependent oxidoreductase [Kineobactrum sediminis]